MNFWQKLPVLSFGIFVSLFSMVLTVEADSASQPLLDFGFESIDPFVLESKPLKDFDIVEWELLNQIPNGSIEQCSPVNTQSASWQFFQTYKQPQTDILLVSVHNTSYPCRYMAEHLRRHRFGMASLEDVPLSILQKFKSPYPIFFREVKFYLPSFYNPTTAMNYLHHEEMHIIQAQYNPRLEQYMWNNEKTKLTDFGRFIEGCTEFHFPTNGPGYDVYVAEYKDLLAQAGQKEQQRFVIQACRGNYDAYLQLTRLKRQGSQDLGDRD